MVSRHLRRELTSASSQEVLFLLFELQMIDALVCELNLNIVPILSDQRDGFLPQVYLNDDNQRSDISIMCR
jgi:hypothetical protein